MTDYIILDCDTGTDDAIALMMLLSNQSNAKVVAITCVGGNTRLENVVMNNLRILKLFNMLEKVPVFKGCPGPLVPVTRPKTCEAVHGSDGLSGSSHVYPPSSPDLLKVVKEEHAANAIVRLSKEYSGKLKIVATGPLTNLALAVSLDHELPSRVKSVFIMGGTKTAAGNATTCAEFNFYQDPESMWITFNAYPPLCKVHLIDFELTVEHGTPWEWYDKWLVDNDNVKHVFAKAVLDSRVKLRTGDNFYVEYGQALVICDAYAMAIALEETVGLKPFDVKVVVELAGHHSRGMIVLDHRNRSPDISLGPIRMYGSIDSDKYHAMLNKAVN